MADGYSFHWRGVYWASLTTAGQPALGRHDAFFGLVGADTHGHPWLRLSSDGSPITGMQLKDNGVHIGSGEELASWSTQVLLRGRAHWDETQGAVVTTIADVFSGSAYSAQPVTSRRTESSRDPSRVPVPVPATADWFEFEVAWLPSSGGLDRASDCVLAFGGGSPCGMRMSVTKWGSAAA